MISYSNGDLKLGEGVGAGDVHLGLISMELKFKALGLDKIIRE